MKAKAFLFLHIIRYFGGSRLDSTMFICLSSCVSQGMSL